MVRFGALLFAAAHAVLLEAAPLRTLPPADTFRAEDAETGMPQSDDEEPPRPRQPRATGAAVMIDGQDYRSLDEYLARLERDGWVGKAWYRQVRPGFYELVTTVRPAPERRLFTRAELERQFGFRQD